MSVPQKQDLTAMIADYMDKGFLENIIDMFLHDASLYTLVGTLIQDDRIRVRIGITALIEELRRKDQSRVRLAVAGLLPLLAHKDMVIRGDAANLLGLTGDRGVVPALKALLEDENSNVRLIAQEAIDTLTSDAAD